MAGVLFEDIFNVKDIDPEGKKFDRETMMAQNPSTSIFNTPVEPMDEHLHDKVDLNQQSEGNDNSVMQNRALNILIQSGNMPGSSTGSVGISSGVPSKNPNTEEITDSDNDEPLRKITCKIASSSSRSSIECGSSDEFFPENESFSSNEEVRICKIKRRKYRWKTRNPKNWKKNVTKARRSDGKTYKNANTQKSPKVPKTINCQNCRFKCSINFSEHDRKLICSNYWRMDYMRQKDFLLSCVKSNLPKCRRIRTGTGTNKLSSRKYHFGKNELQLQVCKMFFLKTLHISHGPVDKALKGVNNVGIFDEPDKRGRNTPANKTSDEMIQRVKTHIEGFPTMESHYCRKSTQRQYLDPSLSIAKMYELYVEECSRGNQQFVSEITYRRIFGTNYNLAFFKPKKDQCSVCEKFKNKFVSEEEYRAHLDRRDEANAAKSDDKLRAASDKEFLSATFDLQSVLRIPSSEISQMYYAMKLCAYNLTIYEAASPNKAYCYAWSEMNGQRGSCEIGTALLNWIKNIPEKIKEISLFSDTCGGQNRNQFIASLFLYIVQNSHLQVVQHNFMEKGHSYMEVDAMHSAIERAKKNVSIYTMNDLLNVFKLARSTRLKNKHRSPYNVKELIYRDFYDLKALANTIIKNKTKDIQGGQVHWLKIKVMRYEKCKPGRILFKYNYSDEDFRVIAVFGRGRPTEMPKTLTPLYKSLLPISEKKKTSLMKLVSNNDIPMEYREWYKSLPIDKKKKNTVPEPTFSESDSDIDF